LWIEPLSDPFLMLQVALYWGVGFISLAVIIKIINSLREGEFARILRVSCCFQRELFLIVDRG